MVVSPQMTFEQYSQALDREARTLEPDERRIFELELLILKRHNKNHYNPAVTHIERQHMYYTPTGIRKMVDEKFIKQNKKWILGEIHKLLGKAGRGLTVEYIGMALNTVSAKFKRAEVEGLDVLNVPRKRKKP